MKIGILFICLFTSLLSFSQTKEYDIYILLNDEGSSEENITQSQNDSIIIQVFLFKEQACGSQNNTFLIDNSGKLKTKIQLKGDSSLFAFNLIYENINGSNEPIIEKSDNIQNLIHYPNDFKNKKIKDILKLLIEAKQIFIIETDNNFGYYMMKKVKIGHKLGGL